MRFIDAHCHLDLFRDPHGEAAACDSSQTYTIAVTNLPSAFANSERIATGRRLVRAAAGLHPELVAQHPEALEQLLPLIGRTKYVGEVGLDYVKAAPSERQIQRRVLARIVEHCEHLGGRVISVHTRRAADDAIELLAGAARSKVILHWFSGSPKAAARAVAAGCLFSVNPAMTRSSAGQRIIAAIPDDRLLTETDGPFVKHEGHEVHAFEVASFLPAIARVRGQAKEAVGSMVLENFRRAVTIGAPTEPSLGPF